MIMRIILNFHCFRRGTRATLTNMPFTQSGGAGHLGAGNYGHVGTVTPETCCFIPFWYLPQQLAAALNSAGLAVSFAPSSMALRVASSQMALRSSSGTDLSGRRWLSGGCFSPIGEKPICKAIYGFSETPKDSNGWPKQCPELHRYFSLQHLVGVAAAQQNRARQVTKSLMPRGCR